MAWTWISVVAGCLSALNSAVTIGPKKQCLAPAASIGVFGSLWIEKGLTLVVAGFVPSPLEHITEYAPTVFEIFHRFRDLVHRFSDPYPPVQDCHYGQAGPQYNRLIKNIFLFYT